MGLARARLARGADGVRALDFDDVYCSREGGLAEAAHVFIEGNDLARRFAAWHSARSFVVAETGFGAGRNMLATACCFERHAPEAARLHLYSIEGHPLAPADLAEMLAAWPELTHYADRLMRQWPPAVEGLYRITLGPRITLDLYLGDVEDGLAGLAGQVDAWCLDGFSPDRNPAMWSASVIAAVAAHSRPGATLATYSVAGTLRRGLAAAGFQCRRRPGFGAKRHCLAACFKSSASGPEPVSSRPWYSLPAPMASGASIAVVGAGIAGLSVAEALARRGHRATVYDRRGIAAGASGNRDGILNPRLAVEASPRTRFDLAALAYVRAWLEARDPERRLWQDCGVLQLAPDVRTADRQQRLVRSLALPETVVTRVDARRAETLAGMALADTNQGGLFFPGAGALRPAALCESLADTPGVQHIARDVIALERQADGWQLTLDDGRRVYAHQLVLACGHAAAALCADLPPIQRVRGQDAQFVLDADQKGPDCVLCGRGYVAPAHDGALSVGATYEPRAVDLAIRAAGHRANRQRLADIAPALAEALVPGRIDGRARWRATSHDRMPLVGGVPDVARWQQNYAGLARDARQQIDVPGALWPGLAVSLAHGSHGLLRAPLAGEMVASALTDTPQPVLHNLVAAVHPGRWLIRRIMRGALASDAEQA